MRNAKLKTVAASFAAVAMIVSLGTSAALARGGGGGGLAGGHFGGGTFLGAGAGFGGLHAGGGFASGRFGGGTFLGGGAGLGGFHAGDGSRPGDRMDGGIHSHRRFYGGYNACVVNPYDLRQNPANSPYTWPYMC